MTKFRTSWTVIKAVIKFFFLLWLIHCLYFIYLFILCERHCFGLIAWMKFHFLSSLTVSFFSSSSSSFESFRIVSRSFCKQSVKLGIIVLDVRIRGSNPSKFVYIKWHSNSSILFLTLNWMNLIRIHYCWSYHSHIHIQTNQTKQKAFFSQSKHTIDKHELQHPDIIVWLYAMWQIYCIKHVVESSTAQ